MAAVRYCSGDMIVLKSRTLGSAQSQGKGQVVALMPEAQGSVRYRVRLQGENFDRSIGEDDIDAEASITRKSDPKSVSPRKPGSSWIDLSIIRAKK